MPLSTIVSSAIYAHYSQSHSSTFVSAVINLENGQATAVREYNYDTRRAILIGFIEIFLTQVKPKYDLVVYTDNMYLYNTISKIKSGEEFKFPIKNQDLIKLLMQSMPLFPNITVEYIDESNELVVCRKEVLRKLKQKSLAKQLLLGMMKSTDQRV